ncbi:MAG TPA: OmpA family protein [Byssovorax sp.]|jgi:peptidoglycan-associated lipoprotein
MNTHTLASSVIVVLAGLAASGCTSKEAETPVLTPPPAVARTLQQGNATATLENRGALSVDDRILKACNLPTPHFDFDSSKIRTQADPGLDKIAACFSSGPLAGRSVRLVGHTDPRGEVEYNFALGQRRAGAVQSYMESHGVSAGKVTSSSRGEMDAAGTDEDTWAQDRRVDMILID